jgi:prevent-host-death family protein
MDRIGVRELNQHTSRYIAQVKAGKSIEVTERGEPVARLVPVRPRSGLVDRLIAAGEIQPPTSDRDIADLLDSLPAMEPDGLDVAAEVARMREEERW